MDTNGRVGEQGSATGPDERRGRGWRTRLVLAALVVSGLSACREQAPEASGEWAEGAPAPAILQDILDPGCTWPVEPEILYEAEGAVLQSWTFRLTEVYTETVLPADPAFLAYREAIRRDGAALRRPIADAPVPANEAEELVWADEHFNNALVYDSGVGRIGPITCLDALLFARQATRVSQLDQPTEFLASVLRRETDQGAEVTVVFGAGSEMFPPKAVYGFDVVERMRALGWSYWYALHNHTVQRNEGLLALGVPVPSTSDVHLLRGLGQEAGLEEVRVTNGFFTFDAPVESLEPFRAR